MNKFLVEFLGTLFFLYVILATGNALAIEISTILSFDMFVPVVSRSKTANGFLSFNECFI